MKCTCAIADSFNVRVADLIDPGCPEHGCRLSRCPNRKPLSEQVRIAEVSRMLEKWFTTVEFNGRLVTMLNTPYGKDGIVRELFSRYDVRRK